MDKLSQMRLFTRVVSLGSFTAAAREAGSTQPTVSKAVAALEADLGVQLISRTTRRLDLTEAGTLYFDRCQRILADIVELDTSVRELTETPVGPLRLQVPEVFGSAQVAPTLGAFLAQNPNVSIEMCEGKATDKRTQSCDLRLSSELPSVSEEAEVIAESEIWVVAAPAYLRALGELESLGILEEADWISVNHVTDSASPRLTTKTGKLVELDAEPRVRTSSPETARRLALDGVGIVALPAWLVARDVEDHGLVKLEAELDDQTQIIRAIVPDGAYVPLRVRVFMDFLKETFADAKWTIPAP